jgi:hypothetical protein
MKKLKRRVLKMIEGKRKQKMMKENFKLLLKKVKGSKMMRSHHSLRKSSKRKLKNSLRRILISIQQRKNQSQRMQNEFIIWNNY